MTRGAVFGIVATGAMLGAGSCGPSSEAPQGSASSGPPPWFEGAFENGDLSAWAPDRARPDSIEIVGRPTRAGRGAARLTLAPGDVAAMKERVELLLANRALERRRAGPGQEAWYAWSLLLPEDLAEAAPGQFRILAQWHHRPTPRAGGSRRAVVGPPPLVLHLEPRPDGCALVLLGRDSARGAPRVLGEQHVEKGIWIDLLFRVVWSLGEEGRVEAWADGRPLTLGVARGRNLYNAAGNYLRLGLYRRKGGGSTDTIYLDEVRIGPTRESVRPRV